MKRQTMNNRRRGTVILLVVATLTLLAVIGTAYIVVARTERSSARAVTDAQLMDMGQEGVINIVRTRMLEQTMTLQTQSASWMTLAAGPQVLQKPLPWRFGTTYAVGQLVMGRDHRVYKATQGGTSTMAGLLAPPPAMGWQLLGGTEYDWRARDWDYPDKGTSGMSTGDLSVLAQGWLVKDLVPQTTADFSQLGPMLLDAGSGQYIRAYAPALAAPLAVATVDPNGPLDAMWHVLPYGSASGVRYRYAVRIVDTNRWANLNTGNLLGQADVTRPYINSVQLDSATAGLFGADPANALHAGANSVPGRGALDGAFDLAKWQNRVLGFERSGANLAAGLTTPLAQWFDLSDELELRANGVRGAGLRCRPAVLWPNTLGPLSAAPATRRHLYTTYSFDRNISPLMMTQGISGPRWKFGTFTWPGDLRQVNLSAQSVRNDLARNAAYLANAMYAAGYSEDEALSTAINYVGQCEEGGSKVASADIQKASISPGGLYIPGAANVTITPAPQRTYIPYRAQPFINELAVQMDKNDQTNPLQDFAVELIQPYAAPVDVTGWQVQIDGQVWIPNLGALFTNGFLPPGFTVLQVGSTLGVNGTSVTVPPPAALNPASSVIQLKRPYQVLGGATKYMLVDYFACKFPPPPDGSKAFSIQRNNDTPAPGTWNRAFMAAVPATYDPNQASPSLGAVNGATCTNANLTPVVLPDRFAMGGPAQTASYSLIQANLGDLHRYMRITHSVDSTEKLFQTVGDIMADSTLLFAAATAQLPQEAKVRCDFLADPRAQRLLQLVAPVDRSGDGVDQMLGVAGPESVDEVRIAGRININTAPLPVLQAIPLSPQLANAIVAYRERLAPYTDATLYPGRGFRSMAELLHVLQQTAPLGSPKNIPDRDAVWARVYASCTVRSDTFVVYGIVQAVDASVDPYSQQWLPSSPTANPYIRASRRFVAIIDRSWCNYPRYTAGVNSAPNLRFVLPRVVAIKELP